MKLRLAAAFAALLAVIAVNAYADGPGLDRWAWGGDGYCPLLAGRGWDGTLALPVAGDVSHWFAGWAHRGIDIDAPAGTPVTAAASGVVVWAGDGLVILAHGAGWQTWYAHLSRIDVSCGQFVRRGDAIGAVGQTRTVWDHLHIDLWRDGQPVDPAPLLGLVAPAITESSPVARGGERRGSYVRQ